MNIRPLNKDVSIVVISNFDKDICSPLTLYKRNLISEREFKSIDESSVVVTSDMVSFKNSDFDLTLSERRLQIKTDRIDKSDRIAVLMCNIIRTNSCKITAIGINASSRIGFFCNFDIDRFCSVISPNDALRPLVGKSCLTNINLREGADPMRPGKPEKNYTISRSPYFKNRLPSLNISLNCHMTVEDDLDIEEYIMQSTMVQSDFFHNVLALIKSIQ